MRPRAAVPEASAGSLPIHALGSRPGAPEAAAEFDQLFDLVVPTLAAEAAADPVVDLSDDGGPGAAAPVRPTPDPTVRHGV